MPKIKLEDGTVLKIRWVGQEWWGFSFKDGENNRNFCSEVPKDCMLYFENKDKPKQEEVELSMMMNPQIIRLLEHTYKKASRLQ